jgi:segregation and condensation protein B
MSLKAKIEAVVYASEEPVTVAQLIGLLGQEAQAEIDALHTRQQTLALEDSAPADADFSDADAAEDEDALNAETIDPGEAATDDSAPDAVLLSEGQSMESKDPDAAGANLTGEDLPGTEVSAQPSEKSAAAATKETARRLREYFRSLLDQLIADYDNGDRGLEIREVAGGYRLATRPEYHDAVRGFVKSLKPPLKLTLQSLETLAVIAYKQPVTAPEISEIRGVDSGGVLGSLLTRKLITTAGRKQVIGRPILYKTTKDFLVRFGLKDINELPSIEEFEKMAGELLDAEPTQIEMEEEIDMEASHRRSEEETTTSVSDADTHASTGEDATPAAGTPTSLDEINSAPEPTTALHESVEDLMSDDSTAPEGHKREHADPHEVEPKARH